VIEKSEMWVLWDVIRGNEPGDLLDGLSKSKKASAEVAEVPVHHFRYVEQKLHDVQTLTAGRCHKLCTCLCGRWRTAGWQCYVRSSHNMSMRFAIFFFAWNQCQWGYCNTNFAFPLWLWKYYRFLMIPKNVRTARHLESVCYSISSIHVYVKSGKLPFWLASFQHCGLFLSPSHSSFILTVLIYYPTQHFALFSVYSFHSVPDCFSCRSRSMA